MEAAIISQYSLRNNLFKNLIDINELDNITDKYDKLYIGDILCFVPQEQIANILSKIKSKLNLGGYLIIDQFDLYELIIAVLNENLSSQDFNNIIAPRQRLFFIYEMVHLLKQLQFKIISKDIDNYRHFIEVQCLN